MFRCDPRAGVFDLEDDAAVVVAGRSESEAARVRVPDRVLNKVR
jgi:hypothetical protein